MQTYNYPEKNTCLK